MGWPKPGCVPVRARIRSRDVVGELPFLFRAARRTDGVVAADVRPLVRGSLNVDDEGNRTQCTTLIEDGILKGYLQDAMNARLMKVAPTGNGRRESFAHVPMRA